MVSELYGSAVHLALKAFKKVLADSYSALINGPQVVNGRIERDMLIACVWRRLLIYVHRMAKHDRKMSPDELEDVSPVRKSRKRGRRDFSGFDSGGQNVSSAGFLIPTSLTSAAPIFFF